MPLYTYTCADHGEFAAWGEMSRSDAPQPCPSCADPAPRAMAAPRLGGRAGEGGSDSAGGSEGYTAPSMGGCACGHGHCPH